jgi:hypothetical protein
MQLVLQVEEKEVLTTESAKKFIYAFLGALGVFRGEEISIMSARKSP